MMMGPYGKGVGKTGLITFPNVWLLVHSRRSLRTKQILDRHRRSKCCALEPEEKKVFIGGLPLTTAPDIDPQMQRVFFFSIL